MTAPDLSGAADIAAARRLVTRALEAAGKDSPALDARLLIQHALGLDHATLAASTARTLDETERARIAGLAARRAAGEPLARIVGSKEFFGLPLALSRTTLVPRPDTETIVDAALADVDARRRRTDALRIADLGTGTGAILLALLHALPNSSGVGTDCDDDALATARRNAEALGLAGRARFAIADFGTGLAGGFDLVVSNPPYIPTREIAALDIEVRDHEPLRALDGGADGLDAYRSIAAQMPALLAPGGAAVLEIGFGQAKEVQAIAEAGGLGLAAIRPDLAGIPRALTFHKRPA